MCDEGMVLFRAEQQLILCALASLPLHTCTVMMISSTMSCSIRWEIPLICSLIYMFLQTNIGNNNNKFYVIQLLEDDKNLSYRWGDTAELSSNKYVCSVWFRWGRVGYDGQNKLVECGSNLQKVSYPEDGDRGMNLLNWRFEAIKEFGDKFEAKTRNDWPTSFEDFVTYPGKYTMIEVSIFMLFCDCIDLQMDYGNGESEGPTDTKIELEQEEEEKKCKVLHSRVPLCQSLFMCIIPILDCFNPTCFLGGL